MSGIAKQKILQVVFALVAQIMFLKIMYERGDIPVTNEYGSTSLIVLSYLLVLPGFLWTVLMWNKWFYHELFKNSNINKIITYEIFQKGWTFVMFITMMVFIIFPPSI